MARNSSSGGSGDPKPAKTRWYKQIWQVFKITRQVEPLVTLWLAIAFFGVIGACVGLGFLWGQVIYMSIISAPIALLAVMIVLSGRAQAAMYKRVDGKEGASYVAIQQIRRGWEFPEEPIAVDARNHDMVFRGLGRAGIVLVGEGVPARLAKLVESERKKITRVAPGVPVTVINCGNHPDQLPVRKLARKIQRLRPKLTKAEVAAVSKRLQAIGGIKLPIPHGVDPLRARPDRKGMRGR